MSIERRTLPLADMEFRAADDGGLRFSGYVARYDRPSQDMGFIERIAPGAFDRTISRGDDVRFLLNHDPNFVLGRTKSGTLRLKSDDEGLLVDGAAPDTQWARDLHVSVKRGDIDQGSFGFRVIKDQHNADRTERKLLEVDLFDVSLVTYPAYEDTDVSARSFIAALRSGQEIDEETRATLTALLKRSQEGRDGKPSDELARLRSYVHDELMRHFSLI